MRDVLKADYRAHEVLVGPAREHAEVWRLVFGVISIIIGFIVFSRMAWGLFIAPNIPLDDEAFVTAFFSGNTPQSTLFLLFQIGLLIPATAFTALALHGRNPLSLLGPWRSFMQQFLLVLVAQIVLTVVIIALPPYSMATDEGALQSGLGFGRWLALLPLSLLCILLQCGAEEYAFRGYLQQQLAARFRHPLIWMILPAVLFAWGHYMPDRAGSNAFAIAVLAGVFGLIAADITARAGTLGPAIAIHMVNNATAILFVAPSDSLSGLALYTMPFGLENETALRPWLWVDLAAMIVSWLAARLVLRK
jgi:membrane protease YdiL (CAAX protease family)